MPGFLLHVNAGVQCSHAAAGLIAPTQPRVAVSGQLVANIAAATSVTGCPFTVPTSKPQPCVLIKWLLPSTRFLVNGQPAALVTGPGVAQGICQSAEQIPQGPPVIGTVQARVVGS